MFRIPFRVIGMTQNAKKCRLRLEGGVRLRRGSAATAPSCGWLVGWLVSWLVGWCVPSSDARPTTNKPTNQLIKTRKEQAMSKIKSTKQFKEQVDAAFATMQTRDEAKAAWCVRGWPGPPRPPGRPRRPRGYAALPAWGVPSPYVGGAAFLHGKCALPTWRV